MKPFYFLYAMKSSIFFMTILAIGFLVLGCNADKATTKAYIEQRAVFNDSTLKISYRYQVQDKLYRDSVEVKNKIVVSDSLIVFFSKNNPQMHAVQMP